MKENLQERCGKSNMSEKVLILRKVKNPKISVIIPTLNEEKNIEECLLSIKNQNFEKPYEIIVSDSNSKDKTVEIAKNHANKIVVSRKRGIGYGRNLGAKYAEGRILVFVDADTRLNFDTISKLYEEFTQDKELVGLTSIVLPYPISISNLFLFSFYNVFVKTSILLKKPQIPGLFCAYRRDIFEKVNGFDESLKVLEDYDLSERISKYGKIKILENTFVYTSTRRIEKWGRLKSIGLYLYLYSLYFIGVKDYLKKFKLYKPIR
ncbi:MAG: glycosyl transferase [Candidatus Aenigmarchaeota archaeon ex4484_224]|nr:MAG: glycosyl transferase [Candidatus Aenigmarchaeota archaeon ex4484_224]